MENATFQKQSTQSILAIKENSDPDIQAVHAPILLSALLMLLFLFLWLLVPLCCCGHSFLDWLSIHCLDLFVYVLMLLLLLLFPLSPPNPGPASNVHHRLASKISITHRRPSDPGRAVSTPFCHDTWGHVGYLIFMCPHAFVLVIRYEEKRTR